MNENIQQGEESLLDWFEKQPEGHFKNDKTDFANDHHHHDEEHKFEFLVQDMFLDHFFP